VKILLAIDESPASEAAVTEVRKRYWPPGTMVRVLHLVEKFVPPAQQLWYDAGGSPDRAREEVTRRYEEMAERMADELRESGLSVETIVRDGNPQKGIVDVAAQWKADLIVVGSHGPTGLKGMLRGNVARAVIDHAPCAVEVVQKQTED
jgi:nucleotide-binding universal stress UspA family protein